MTAKSTAAKPIVSAEETHAPLQGMQDARFPEFGQGKTGLVVATPASREIAQIQAEMGGFTGSEGLTLSDMVVPRYKIVQPTSKKGTQGNFFKVLTEEEVPAIDAIVIRVEKGRVMWDPGNMEEPICRSLDYFHPDPRIETPQNAICCTGDGKQVCSKGEWRGKTKPECNMTYALLCIDRNDFMPFWLTVHGTSVEPVKRLNTTANFRGKGKFYIFNVTFSLEQQINDKGKYYVLKISPPESRYEKDTVTPLTPEEEVAYMEMVKMCWNASLQRTLDEEAEVAAQEGGGGESVPTGKYVEGAPDWLNQEA